MCVSARGIFSCKGINTLLLQFGLRVVSYSVMMFVRKKLPQQYICVCVLYKKYIIYKLLFWMRLIDLAALILISFQMLNSRILFW